MADVVVEKIIENGQHPVSGSAASPTALSEKLGEIKKRRRIKLHVRSGSQLKRF